jgi:hypothetical protein
MEQVTAAEHAAGRLADAKIERLTRAFAESGFVTLGNVVPDHAVLAELEESLDLAAAVQLLQGEDLSRTTQGPLLPRGAPWVRPEVNANPVIEQLVVHLLGGEAFIRWHGSNTSLPMPPGAAPLAAAAAEGWEGRAAEGMQHLHMDGWGWSVPDEGPEREEWMRAAHPTYKIFVNYAVSDMTPERGSTQLWPATNTVLPSATAMPCNVQAIDAPTMEPILQARAAQPGTAPVQVVVPRGGCMLRDLRCWHRGMPNYSTMPRHMLGVAYGAVHDPGAETSSLGMGIHEHTFSRSCEAVFQSENRSMRRNIKFVAGPVDSGGKAAKEEGFAVATGGHLPAADDAHRRAQVLAPLVGARGAAAAQALPWWLRELAAGRRLERASALSRL